MPLTSFVLIGTILSFDNFLATVEFQLNPPTNGGPSIAIIPVEGIPCDVEVGKTIYVVKNASQKIPVITCKKEKHED
jgi:hypothetical protein